jgi:hypothetical protein
VVVFDAAGEHHHRVDDGPDDGTDQDRKAEKAEQAEDESEERDTKHVPERNVLGGPLEPCGTDPLTGYYRDGCCSSGPEDLGRHTICAVMTDEFLDHQRSIGNDLLTPVPEYRFPGLLPGDRWCVTALNWLRAHHDGCAAPVVLASTHERTLQVVPLEALQEHKVDVPDDLANL